MVDSKYLKGLKVSISVDKGVKEVDGKKLRVYETQTRDARPDDVLAHKDYGDSIVLVTLDGKKHTVNKAELIKHSAVKTSIGSGDTTLSTGKGG